ncbi:MAG: pilus assembly protein TadG-related protein [Alphaproteobacteria bacterium]
MGWVVVRLRRLLRRKSLLAWLGAEAASVAMIFAIAMLPMMAATGAAVDLSRALWVRARLGQALDAAGLAVGSTPNLDQSQTQDLAKKYFDANYPTDDLGTPSPLNVSVNGNVVDLSATAELDTTLMALFGINHLDVGVSSQITRESKNLEIAVMLDTTGSMLCANNSTSCPPFAANFSDTRIAALQIAANDLIDLIVQDVQTPTYSKMSIIPWAVSVNVGGYADQVRGAITGGVAISNVVWAAGAAKVIGDASKTSPVKITSNGHGLSTGDRVFVKNAPSMSEINNKQFTITFVDANNFTLNGSSGTHTYALNTGTVTKCQMSDCSLVVTANGHGLSNGDNVYIAGAGGITAINSPTPGNSVTLKAVASVTANTFDLPGVTDFTHTYTSGSGTSYCVKSGCQYYYFQNANSSHNLYQISTCVSERTDANAYTDVAPNADLLGPDYVNPHFVNPSPNNPCIGQTIVPLTSDKTVLHNTVNGLTALGSTAGHIGTAWAWYMISPNFSYLWPSDSQPAAYGTKNLLKVAILMTDGLYNTVYCNGVIGSNSQTVPPYSGYDADHINCPAPNGDSYTQSRAICDNMKKQGIIIYTVGFDISNDPNAQAIMNYCAMDANHVYLPNSSSDLAAAFHAIAADVTALRISK